MIDNSKSITIFNQLFASFTRKCITDFAKNEESNKSNFNSLLNDWNNQDVRPNISVLAIIPSKY